MDQKFKQGTLDLILLSVLEEKPMYGLEILKAVNSKSGGIFSFKEGSLYPSLHKLVKEKCIEASWEPSTSGGPPRKYYKVTDTGIQTLKSKKEEWATLKTGMDLLLRFS
ncbi:PadR family transcriptional regulator [Deinococcus cellulosilyticus]|uniref:Pex-like protein n=1 Tax=Deinococcus cellulosilyticus (strain DSM 18568 / NBRC 106333 / KACC 11606 / 5516J-15) TaxID=1223518 RepID=A0A511N0N4_DEIC1|nr:PadR family transcriptional regulator [Deinococcus cellulosilyticus]GEM46422.1 Pex-like protein [Deinococcus cellulosilyticus NBRC 106333 = KACC 11606]